MEHLEEKTILKYIMLSQMQGLGAVTQNALLDISGGIERCFSLGYEKLMYIDEQVCVMTARGRIGKKRMGLFIAQRDDEALRCRAEMILNSSKKAGIELICREDSDYPQRFENIPDLPVLLYCKGNLRINEFEHSIGVVGARRCIPESKENAIDIASKAALGNVAVISGMAKGIDSYAHTAVLKAQGYTVAVLGNGADICYPREHEKLYADISEWGCIVSEYPPGTAPRKYYFPQRNRLIAALSDELYVIEAGRNSGTRSTVDSCQKYGRNLKQL